MSERDINSYRQLFAIRLLHHYWLDNGANLFDKLSVQEQTKRLLSYDMRRFLSLSPTAPTLKSLSGLGCVYKNTTMGCVVAVQESGVIPPDTTFEFAVTVQDSAFYNYTALTLRPQKIYELYHKPDDKIYRFKENIPVLSNVTGTARTLGSNKTLFLSRELPSVDDGQVESFLVPNDNALYQLTSEQPITKQKLNDEATKIPVFVHQGDVPAIVPPNGLTMVPSRGIVLSEDIPDNVFLLIRLSAIRGDDGDFSFIDSNGHAKATFPVFQIHFKNRSTIWKYFNKSTGAVVSTESNVLPLTSYGNAGTEQKPSQGLVKVEKGGDKITRIVSEIFV